MYEHYYSAADAQVYLTSLDHTRIVKLDSAISIGYSLTQSSTPIYSLGYRKAQFFSQGNTLGHGSLALAFTDEEALKYALSYLYENEEGSTYSSTRLGKKSSNSAFIAKANAGSFDVQDNKRLNSIGAVKALFNIKLFLNNETAVRGSDSKVICLTGVKLIGESMPISNQIDGVITQNYNFYFKDVERG